MSAHYHYGSGMYGCLYQDGPHTCHTLSEAIDALSTCYQLTRAQRNELRTCQYTSLNLKHGNEYAEITRCNCPDNDCGV